MKYIKNLVFLFGMILMFSSCETDVVDPAGSRNDAVVPGILNLNPATYDVNDLSNTYIQFDLTLPSPVDEVALVVSYKGGKQRKELMRINNFPATGIRVPLTTAATALGLQLSDIKAADVFNFEVQTIQGGKVYYSSAAFNAAVVCGYSKDNVTGSYHFVSAAWESEGDVTITADPDDPYTLFINGLAAAEGFEDTGSIKLVVNPINYAVTAVKSTISPNIAQYTNYTYQGSGQLNTCNGQFDMLFTITVDQGSFGNFAFTFTKN